MMVSDVPQIIESCGFCRAEKVKSLRAMKSGMTNRSYSFCMDDKRYIIRIPGEGTDRLINRKQEHAVYNAISSLGISEDVYYFDPKTGIKIAAYLTDAHVCDSSNWEEVERCWLRKPPALPVEAPRKSFSFKHRAKRATSRRLDKRLATSRT